MRAWISASRLALLVLAACLLAAGCRSAGGARRVAPGVTVREASLPGGDGSRRVWIYLPEKAGSARLPVVLIAPARAPRIPGIGLAKGDRPEHLPYVRAGFAVVAYSLDGSVDGNPSDAELLRGVRAFIAAGAGVVCARAALDYALGAVPQLDARRVHTAGHSSAATVALLVAAGEPRIRACVAFAPVCDVQTHLAQAMAPLGSTVTGFERFVQGSSPLTQASAIRCPVFLFHADDDRIVSHQDVAGFAAVLQRTHRSVTFVRVPTGGHYDSMISEGIPRAIRWLGGRP